MPYESYRENPFRFGNFTTAGEFYVETGLSAVGMTEYRRELSLDSARVLMQFKKDGVKYQRTSFISYPANVLVMRFAASEKGKQNLTFSYALIRYLPARFRRKERMGWSIAPLDNNQMEYVVMYASAATQAAPLAVLMGKLRIEDADEVVFLITADTGLPKNPTSTLIFQT